MFLWLVRKRNMIYKNSSFGFFTKWNGRKKDKAVES